MACETWAEKLDAYVDGELPETETRTLGAHIGQCASCAATAVEAVRLKRSVALAGKHYRPSAYLRQKITQIAHPSHERSSAAWGWKLVFLPAALILIISLSTYFFAYRGKARRDRAFGELADQHVITLASAAPVDVLSTDRHTVKPWFEGKIPFSFNLPELQGTDFTLVGGKITYLAQTPGAQLLYKIRKHEISVFIFQDRELEMANWSSDPAVEFSFTFETWAKNGLRYFVVGDVSPAEIDALSKVLRDSG
ncbi:MAG TPA: zf-HC2 domain-containing protein [Candidatus Sulfotelmatobacter sp.]|nr:zf-HC2 domain-containing protein [Candidatus Sulfotelmatobacter sp.]